MEPTLPTPVQPERYSAPPVENQQGAEQYSRPESPVAGSAERVGEMRPVVSVPAPAQPVQAQALVPTPQQMKAHPTSASQPTGSPLIADDVDVIEKEWVDKAKKIVSSTKEDPHMQERQVSALQADYLFKRYNKKIKLAE